MRLSMRLSIRLLMRLSVRLSMRLSISFFITSRLKTLFSIDYWPFESFEVFERLEVIHGQHGLWRNVAALFLANNDARIYMWQSHFCTQHGQDNMSPTNL